MKEQKFEVKGIKGIKNVPFTKVFKSQEQFEKWLEKNEGSVEVHSFRDVE